MKKTELIKRLKEIKGDIDVILDYHHGSGQALCDHVDTGHYLQRDHEIEVLDDLFQEDSENPDIQKCIILG